MVDADGRGDGQPQIAVPRLDGRVRLVEGQVFAAGVARRRDGQRRQRAAFQVGAQMIEVQHPAQQRLHGAVIQQRLRPFARQPRIHPSQRQQAQPAHTRAYQARRVGAVDHVGIERRPQPANAAHAQVRAVGAAGQRGGVDRARRRAADDVKGVTEAGLPVRVQQLHDGAEHTDLVGGARAAPRQDQADRRAGARRTRWTHFNVAC
ncbi:hypothetical protein D3C78_1112170 [compost metagenome]